MKAEKESSMLSSKIKYKYSDIDGTVVSKDFIIEVPLTHEMIQDCFLYNAVDAPSEIKSMIMTILGETIDKIILGERPDYVNEEWLIDRLDKVKIT
jgi:hypothetical protein